jgi:hypothetical protein
MNRSLQLLKNEAVLRTGARALDAAACLQLGDSPGSKHSCGLQPSLQLVSYVSNEQLATRCRCLQLSPLPLGEETLETTPPPGAGENERTNRRRLEVR